VIVSAKVVVKSSVVKGLSKGPAKK
jgi:hypothetical protein